MGDGRWAERREMVVANVGVRGKIEVYLQQALLESQTTVCATLDSMGPCRCVANEPNFHD